MALESATRGLDLNSNFPTDGDPAKVGAAHLRMIKAILKQIGVGSVSLAEARALTAPFGTTFIYNDQLYQIQPDYIGTTAVEDISKVIFLTNGNKAYKLNSGTWLGDYVGSDVTKPTNLTAFRYPTIAFIKGAGSVFNESAADAAMPNSTPVVGDIVAYQTISGSPFITEARIWSGSSLRWVKIPNEINGHTFNFGILAALRVVTPTVIATQIRSHNLELVGATNMEITNPDGFGPDSLYYWFGKKEGLVDGNGEILYALLTKANAYKWGQVGSTGAVEGGGGTDPGLPGTPASGGAILAAFGMANTYRSVVEAYHGDTANANVIINLRNDGTFAINVAGDVTGFPLDGNFLTTPAANVGTRYEYKIEPISGAALDSGYVSSYTPLSSTKQIFMLANSSGASVFKESTFKLTMREIATPANLVTANITLSARAQSFTGSPP